MKCSRAPFRLSTRLRLSANLRASTSASRVPRSGRPIGTSIAITLLARSRASASSSVPNTFAVSNRQPSRTTPTHFPFQTSNPTTRSVISWLHLLWLADRRLALDLESRRAGNTRSAVTAVATGVLREVLLVIVLRVVELRSVKDLRGDPTVALGLEPFLVQVARSLREPLLLRAESVDARAVLRTDIRSLTHASCRVVTLPEDLQQALIRETFGIEHHQHDLVVAREPGADLPVVGIRSHPRGVTDGGGMNSGKLPKRLLRAPETAHPEHRPLCPFRKRRRKGRPQNVVTAGHRHLLRSPWEGFLSGRELGFLHGRSLARPRGIRKLQRKVSRALIFASRKSARGTFRRSAIFLTRYSSLATSWASAKAPCHRYCTSAFFCSAV